MSREVMQQARDALASLLDDAKLVSSGMIAPSALTTYMIDAEDAIAALRAALAEQAQPVASEFDHGIGADRFKVVKGAFWWHVRVGDSTANVGKFHSKDDAERMAALLLREFRNGAFVQCNAAAPEGPTPPAPVVPPGWHPISEPYEPNDELDIMLSDGSILCAVLPQFDGDLWWGGDGTGEKFIDPKYANVTHWRLHAAAPEAHTWSKAAETYAADAERFRWLAEHTVATGLARWVHPFQFLGEAVDARRNLHRP